MSNNSSPNKEMETSLKEKIDSDSSTFCDLASRFLSWHSQIAHKDTWELVLRLCGSITFCETTRRRVERFSALSKMVQSFSPKIEHLLDLSSHPISNSTTDGLEDIKKYWELWKDIITEIDGDPAVLQCWEIRNYSIGQIIQQTIPLQIKQSLERYIRKEILFPLPIDYLENQFLVDQQLKEMSLKIESLIPQTWPIFEDIAQMDEGIAIFTSLLTELMQILTTSSTTSGSGDGYGELRFASQSSLVIKIVLSLHSWLEESDKLAIQIQSHSLITGLQSGILSYGFSVMQKVLQSFIRDGKVKSFLGTTRTSTTTTTPSNLDLILVESEILISNSYQILSIDARNVSTTNDGNVSNYKDGIDVCDISNYNLTGKAQTPTASPLKMTLLEYEVLHCNMEDEYLRMVWEKIVKTTKTTPTTMIEDTLYCAERVFERGKSLKSLKSQVFTSINERIFKPLTTVISSPNQSDCLVLFDLAIVTLQENAEMAHEFTEVLLLWRQSWKSVLCSTFLTQWKQDHRVILNSWISGIIKPQQEQEQTITTSLTLLEDLNLPAGEIRNFGKEIVGKEIMKQIADFLFDCRLKDQEEAEKIKREVKEFLFHSRAAGPIDSPLKEKIVHMLGVLSSSTLEDAKVYLQSEYHDIKFTPLEISRLLGNRIDFLNGGD